MIKSKNKKDKPKKKRTAKEAFWHEVKGYAEALLIAFFIVTFIFTTVGVVGSSMRPNLNGGDANKGLIRAMFTGDRVFIPKYDTWLRRMDVLPNYNRGDILVVREPKNSPTRRPGIKSLQNIPFIKEIPYVQGRPFFIKRLIGLPGDHIYIEKGQVYVNGHAIDQSFITSTGEIIPYPFDFPRIVVENGEITAFQPISSSRPLDLNSREVQYFYGHKDAPNSTIGALAPIPEDAPSTPFIHEIIVPEDHYFVMGDNRTRTGSVDSRYFGPIPTITVAGKATTIIWPPMRGEGVNWRGLRPPEAFKAIPSEYTP